MSFTLLFMSEVKPHLVANEVWADTVDDLQARFGGNESRAMVRSGVFRLDLGGSLMQDAVWVSVPLGRLTLEVMARDVGYFFDRLREAQPRQGGAYKLHGRLHAVVLTTEQRRKLLIAWGQDIDKWKAVAAEEAREMARRREHIAAASPDISDLN